jgi:DNA modification methylase/superfamily II DNA or RNA helicase
MTEAYAAFLESKGHRVDPKGFEPLPVHPALYPFQSDIVRWAVKLGRAAIFADCGLGKSFMQLEWARQISRMAQGISGTTRRWRGQVLIVAPLAVGQQTIEEAKKLGLDVSRDPGALLQITNYEQLHKLDPADYAGIVLDESSILKSLDGATRTDLLKRWTTVPYRLACTATPAPNDVSELANHAEFLGAMSRVEMLATFFVHDSDTGEWRLKGHAAGDMWRWCAKWSVFVRRPSDLGYQDEGWALPGLSITDEVVHTGLQVELGGISSRPKVRKLTLEARVVRALEIISGSTAWPRPEKSEELPSADNTPPTAISTSSGPSSGRSAIRTASEISTSGESTDSARTTTTPSTSPKGVSAPFAEDPQSPGTCSTSTTTTVPAPCVGSFVAPAIVPSGSFSTIQSPSLPHSSISSGDQWLVWCNLNAEEEALEAALGDQCVVISGRTSEEDRIRLERDWREGRVRVLITKPKVFGFGMNWQHCHRTLFLGLGDSYEQYYQAIRRIWRFGQTSPVDVRIVISDVEGAIADNVKRKEEEAKKMAESIVAAMGDEQAGRVRETREDVYQPKEADGENWALLLGDSVERIKEIPDASVGFSVYSPPFASLYTYSSSRRDLGNSKTHEEFFKHYSYLIPEILRVTMPGRRTAVHCQQLSKTKNTHGYIGWWDFRGDLIRAYERAGWIYDGEICIDKNPQAQAIRTKSKQLMFVQKEKDSSWLRPAMADYILLFRHPVENPETPVKTDVSNEEWILFAHPIWYGIRESDVLKSYREGRADEDEKHICPLQLETIERCIRLWSNPGDVILSPFAGIGSEGYVARRFGRRFIGIELKESYWQQAVANLQRADAEGPMERTEAVGVPERKAS